MQSTLGRTKTDKKLAEKPPRHRKRRHGIVIKSDSCPPVKRLIEPKVEILHLVVARLCDLGIAGISFFRTGFWWCGACFPNSGQTLISADGQHERHAERNRAERKPGAGKVDERVRR